MDSNSVFLKESIDLSQLKQLFENFSVATGLTTSLVDHNTQEVLIETGWRDICVQFHRSYARSKQQCQLSNKELVSDLSQIGQTHIQKCKNGLIQGAIPIIIRGNHLADLFTSQIFFSPPDISYFKNQAHEYGYDERTYLECLAKVPVVSEEKFTAALRCLTDTALVVIQLSLTRTEAHQKASANESLLQGIFNTAPVGICFMLNRIIQEANPQLAKMTGYSHADLNGKSLRMLYFDDETFEQVGRQKQIQFRNTGSFSFDTQWRKNDGSLLEVHLQSTLLDDNAPSKGEIATILDITELKKTENDLKISEVRLKEAQKVAHVGNWELDIPAKILHWSDEIYRIFGIQPQQTKATYELFWATIHPDDRKMVQTAYTKHIEEKNHYDIDHRVVLKDGTIKHVHERCRTEYDGNGNPVRSLGTVQDITIRKIAEDKLQKSHLELEKRVIKRTAELKDSNLKMRQEIRERKSSEQALYKSEISLVQEQATLQEANITLKVLMRKLEQEKIELEEQVSANILGLIEPYLNKLSKTGLDERQNNYLQIIKSNLDNIVSPFVKSSVAMNLSLTPTEIQIANLIKQDKSSKEIAELLTLSKQTIDKHRNNIRKKLGITHKKINLKTLLGTQK